MGNGELHKGHRQRMFKRFCENGIGHFEDHEKLEMLLYSIYPRCNTNEISHRLIAAFGSVERVVGASVNELMTIDDVGEQAAVRLHFFSEFFRDMFTKRLPSIPLGSARKIIEYCCELYSYPMSREMVYALYLDKGYNLISQSVVGKGCTDFAGLDTKTAVLDAISCGCSSVVLAHNHPSGGGFISSADVSLTREFSNLLRMIHLSLTDHIIVCGDTGQSLRSAELLKDIWS
ncbi:MAG: hypothetical protein NC299_02065 [Lachnospiraceae bacterium]|nr:hypothetical protein [Ruminococcus sp.]MCM1274133.1 hypothetical protein [Lachnospiraceae bacterium]